MHKLALILAATLALATPVVAAQPIELIEMVYAEVDNTDHPPGGFGIWSREIGAIWQAMLDRRVAAGLRSEFSLAPIPPGVMARPVEIELVSESGDTIVVRGIYDPHGEPIVMLFELIREDGDWKINDTWRDGSTDPAHRLSVLLKTLP